MSNVRPVIDARYACASGPKFVGDASPNPSPVIRCKFQVWKKKTNLIFFQVGFFSSSFALCFVSYFTVFPFFVSSLSV
jgi:hypothetical protein